MFTTVRHMGFDAWKGCPTVLRGTPTNHIACDVVFLLIYYPHERKYTQKYKNSLGRR